MNRNYRLVWNRAKGVLQVVAEFVGGARVGSCAAGNPLRRAPLAVACAWALGAGSLLAAGSAMAEDVVLPGGTEAGNLEVETPDDISQAGAITVEGNTTLSAHAISLFDAANDFVGTVSITAQAAAIRDSNALRLGTYDIVEGFVAHSTGALDLGNGSVEGTLQASSGGGDITQSGTVHAGGFAADSGGGSISHGALQVDAAYTAMTSGGSIDFLEAAQVGGTFFANIDGGDLRLHDTLSVGGDFNVMAPGGSVEHSGALDVGGNYMATAGEVTQGSGAIQVQGTTALLATGGSVQLDHAGNDFGGEITLLAGDARVADRNSLSFFTFSVDSLEATSNGTMTVANMGHATGEVRVATHGGDFDVAGMLNIGGDASFDLGAGTLTAENVNDFRGEVSLTAGSATLADASALALGDLQVGGMLEVTANGQLGLGRGNVGGALLADSNGHGIGQSGALQVGGPAVIGAGSGAVVLDDANNDFAGAVTLDAGAATIVDRNALDLDGFDVDSLDVTTTGTLALGNGSATGNLTARTNGGMLTQSGSLSVGGDTTIDAGSGEVSLGSTANAFGGEVSITAGSAAITDSHRLLLGTLAVDGALHATSGDSHLRLGTGYVGGDLVATASSTVHQAGALSVGGETRIDAGAAPISLDDAGNDFSGRVSLKGSNASVTDVNALMLGTLDLVASLAATSNGAMDLGSGKLAGNLVVASNGGAISQDGSLEVGSTTVIDAGSGAITLDDAGNDFRGLVHLTGDSIAIHDTNDLRIATLDHGIDADVRLVAGDRLILDPGDIDTGSGELLLQSGTLLSTPGALSGGDVTLGSGEGLSLTHDVAASDVLTLSGGAGSIDQSGGSLVAAVLAGGAPTTGEVALTSGDNAIGALGDFQAGGFSLVNDGGLRVDGRLSAVGDVHLDDAGGILVLGAIEAGGRTTLATGTSMQVGDGGTRGSLSGDIAFDGTLAFDRSDAVAYAGALSGTGTLVQQGAGMLVLDGDSAGFAGDTQVRSGRLVVGSTAGSGAVLGGAVSVEGGATLAGHGRIAGDVAVAAGATLAPGNSIGTLAVGGDLHLQEGSTLSVGIGAPGPDFDTAGTSDRVDVDGDVFLEGATLDVTDTGSLGPGLYTLLTWGGSLVQSNGGLALGATPHGADLHLQVLGDRINVLGMGGMELRFWNGDGSATDTTLGGGSGIWSATASAWTDAGATVTGPMHPQPAFAVFGGAAGTVEVDAGDGAVAASGLQFASDGYRLAGNTLVLAGAGGMPTIRVGDGSATGAAMTATIENALAGSDGLRKDDAGTLVLAGANTYSGGTVVAGGVLQVASDANLGAAGGEVALDGGTLATTAGFDTARDFEIGEAGGAIRTGGDLAVHGRVTGPGLLHKTGDGVLTLTGATNAFGGASIEAGTLALRDAGSAAGTIVLHDGAAFDISQTDAVVTVAGLSGEGHVALGGNTLAVAAGEWTFAGTLADGGLGGGSGGALSIQDGTLFLTGVNTYTGATRVGAGATLALAGDASIAASSRLGIDGTLVFAGAGHAFDAEIEGGGLLRHEGQGTLLFDGDGAAFAGNTQVASGTLVVGGSAGSTAVLGGDVHVADGASLGGHGRVGGNVTNAGTLAPGSSIGTLTVGGDYTQEATGALQIEARPGGDADRLVVEGRATLDGSMLVLAQGDDWRARTDYTLLTAGDGISGEFAATQSSLAFLAPVLDYGTNAVTLTLLRNDIAFSSVAETRNQYGVATAADALGWDHAVHAALAELDAGGARAAFDALSGEIHAATRNALLEDARRLEQTVVLQSASAPRDGRGFWASGWGGQSALDGDGNAAALETESSGIAVGGDIQLGNHARIGAVVAGSRLQARLDARASRGEARSRHAGLHLRVDMPVATLQAGVLRGWHDIDGNRSVAFGHYQVRLQAEGEARTRQVFLDVSGSVDLGSVKLIPFADVAWVRLRSDAFEETGGDAALRVEAGEVSRRLASAGLHGEWHAGGNTRLWASAGWLHASGAEPVAATQRFATGDVPFDVSAAPLDGGSAIFDTGVRWQPGAGTTLEAAYHGRFGDGLRDQGMRVSLRWTF